MEHVSEILICDGCQISFEQGNNGLSFCISCQRMAARCGVTLDAKWHGFGLLPRSVDYYEYPIDLRPQPKLSSVDGCIEHLRKHGDQYGVKLLNQLKNSDAGQEDITKA